MSFRAGLMLGASMRYSTTGKGPADCGRKMKVFIVPSAVSMSTSASIMGDSLPVGGTAPSATEVIGGLRRAVTDRAVEVNAALGEQAADCQPELAQHGPV